MDAKREFVRLASKAGVNRRELCRRFGISPTTGYELLRRWEEGGEAGLRERSRRPASSPARTGSTIEQLVLAMRDETHWGARKIAHRLKKLGVAGAPPRPTVHNILRRHGRIDLQRSLQPHEWTRFEHPHPNDLWQMDFKGWFTTGAGRCHPLTILDDHSRFSLALRACVDETTQTVQAALERVFQQYGLPWRMTMDNGSPWGDDGSMRLTKLTAWIVRLGVRVSHSRPYHPQTQGKDERFHETLNAELLRFVVFRDLDEAQHAFDRWRDRYNLERPHEALGDDAPAEHYTSSSRSMPEALPPIEYDSTDTVCKADRYGKIRFRGRQILVGKGCTGLPVAIRPTLNAGLFDVFFCHQKIAEIDLRTHTSQVSSMS